MILQNRTVKTIVCVVVVSCIFVASAPADVIVDNGDIGTSSKGSWLLSGGTPAYGTNSLWARNGATYTWAFDGQPEGTFEVLMWWSYTPSRSSEIDVEIKHARGFDKVTVNQRSNAGRWNSLGEYDFRGSGSVTITAAVGSNSSTCADAVWFRSVSSDPPPSGSDETIVDNRDSATRRTGTWSPSGGSDPYGADSLYSRDGATFTWYFTPPGNGDYEVSMWWTEWSSRSTDAPVDVVHADGTAELSVNQRAGGGRWNSLGVYPLRKGRQASVTLIAEGTYPTSYCADAVKFAVSEGNQSPLAVIDYIAPDQVTAGQTVYFQGHGEDSDGSIAAYNWESSIDGHLSTKASFSTAALSEGAHEIFFEVQDNGGRWSQAVSDYLFVNGQVSTQNIIDNRDAATRQTGTWEASSGPDPYGADSVYGRDGATFTWYFTPAQSGNYQVDMWWTEWPSRSTAASVNISHANGTAPVTVNQQTRGGQWNSLGVYRFDASDQAAVTLYANDPHPTSYSADAVRFTRTSSPQGNAPYASFYANRFRGGAPFAVQFYDQSEGDPAQWNWDFGDGNTSSEKSPLHTYNKGGLYTVRLTVSNSAGSDTRTRRDYIDIKASTTENVYLVDGFSGNDFFISDTKELMRDMGAAETSYGWRYEPSNSNMTYHLRTVHDPVTATNALKENNAHVVLVGHANFGFGMAFAEPMEIVNQTIDHIFYVDDDSFVRYCTDGVTATVENVKYDAAYPNWEPIFRDGRSALMPYDFGDPRGNPPYNYYITYKIPGDSTLYRIELPNGSYLQRYPRIGVPAWYSADGSPPDPDRNPQYFIRNTDQYYNYFEWTGDWVIRDLGYGYVSHNYQVQWRGSGSRKATWHLAVPRADWYEVSATWPVLAGNATDARYTINHANGSDTVRANQTSGSGRHSLGWFYFNAGPTTVVLSDYANGQVVADAVIMRSSSREIYTDNTFLYKPHIKNSGSGRVICYTGEDRIKSEQLRYNRLFHGSCKSFEYFAGTCNRGLVYAKLDNVRVEHDTAVPYLEYYLKGYRDSDILDQINRYESIHVFYNFNEKPPSMR